MGFDFTRASMHGVTNSCIWYVPQGAPFGIIPQGAPFGIVQHYTTGGAFWYIITAQRENAGL